MNQEIIFTKDETLIILARYCNSQSINSELSWDLHVGSLKRTIIPASKEILDTLEVSDWQEVIVMAKSRYKDLEREFNTLDQSKINSYLSNEMAKFTVLKQITPYRDFFTKSTVHYNNCAVDLYNEKNIKLMKAHGLIRIFGSWNEVKVALGIKSAGVGIGEKYEKDYLIEVIKKHGQHFSTPTWDKYARENDLPSLLTIVKHVPKNILLQYTNYTFNYTTDDLIKIAITHRDYFILSVRKWNAYAQKYSLPNKQTYINQLGKDRHNKIIEVLEINPCIKIEELKAMLLR